MASLVDQVRVRQLRGDKLLVNADGALLYLVADFMKAHGDPKTSKELYRLAKRVSALSDFTSVDADALRALAHNADALRMSAADERWLTGLAHRIAALLPKP